MNFRLALALILPMGLAACGDTDFAMPWDRPEPAAPEAPAGPPPLRAPQVSPLQVPIEIEGGEKAAVATAERTTLDTTAFVARGNEPFWTVEIAGNTARYITPETPNGRNVQVQRIVYANGVEYVGELGGRSFTVNIRPQECADTMSGERFPMTARLRTGSQGGAGCARPATAAAQ